MTATKRSSVSVFDRQYPENPRAVILSKASMEKRKVTYIIGAFRYVRAELKIADFTQDGRFSDRMKPSQTGSKWFSGGILELTEDSIENIISRSGPAGGSGDARRKVLIIIATTIDPSNLGWYTTASASTRIRLELDRQRQVVSSALILRRLRESEYFFKR
jgi:hypothetical protein